MDYAVYLRGFSVAAGDAGRIHQHSHSPAQQLTAARFGDSILGFSQFSQAFGDETGGHMVGKVGSISALFGRESKESAPIQLGRLYEFQKLLMVCFGFARIAHDEVGTKCSIWFLTADVLDSAEEPVAFTPAAHTAQKRA